MRPMVSLFVGVVDAESAVAEQGEPVLHDANPLVQVARVIVGLMSFMKGKVSHSAHTRLLTRMEPLSSRSRTSTTDSRSRRGLSEKAATRPRATLKTSHRGGASCSPSLRI